LRGYPIDGAVAPAGQAEQAPLSRLGIYEAIQLIDRGIDIISVSILSFPSKKSRKQTGVEICNNLYVVLM
jgi:hypothetical protein